MMRNIILLTGLVISSFPVFSQVQITQGAVFDPQFGIIKEHITPKPKVSGSSYLYNNWRRGTIYLVNQQKLTGYPLNYELELHMVEVETKDGIKVVAGNKVAKVTLINQSGLDSTHLLNCHAFNGPEAPRSGFYEIINKSKDILLLRHTKLEVLPSNYNVIMDVGSKEERIIKKDKLYLAKDNEISVYNKRTLQSMFGKHKTEVEKYAKANRLKYKNADDVAKLLTYYNSL